MHKREAQSLMNLTKEWLEHYWKLELEYLYPYLDEGIVMIGISLNEFSRGKNMVREALEQFAKDAQPQYMLLRECIVVQQNFQSCVITGRYLVANDAERKEFEEALLESSWNTEGRFHTFTFVWTQKDGETDIRIKHIHLSDPALQITGRQVPEYTVTLQKEKQRISVINMEGYPCFIYEPDVLYVASDGRYCLIHMTDGTCMKAKLKLFEFMERAGTAFYRFHRKYAVNRSYVAAIPKYRLVLVDGTSLPIPVKQYIAVLNELSEDKKRFRKDRKLQIAEYRRKV